MSYTIRLFIKEAGCPIKTKHLYAQEKSQQESGESILGLAVMNDVSILHCTDTNQYTTPQVHEEQQRSIEPSKAVAASAPVQADLGHQQGFPQMMGCNQQKQEQSGMSYGAASQQLGPSAGVGRLPLPKLMTLVKSKSNSEQGVENTLVANIEGTSSQMQRGEDLTPTSSFYNDALSTQAKNLVISSSKAPSPCVVETRSNIENKSVHGKLEGMGFPKLKLFDRSTKDEYLVDRQEDMEKNHQQCSAPVLSTTNEDNLVAKDNVTNRKPDQRNCPQQMSATGGISQQGFSHLASPPLPSDGEQVASKVLDGNDGMEVSHSRGYNQQVQGSVTSQADQLNMQEVSGQRGGAACDYEEGEFYDAEDGNFHGSEKFGEENEVDEGRTLEAPSKSSPRTTPGVILI